MKKIVYLLLKIIIISFMVLNLTGCWDKIELDNIAIVMGIGIDKPKESDEVHMTVQVANPAEIKSASTDITGSRTTNTYFNLEHTGDTIFSTLGSFSKQSSRKLFFAQNQVVILGRWIAEEGLEKYIDFFLRDRETRLLVWILISDKTANEILYVKSDFESIPSRSINELVKEQQFNSEAPMVDLHEFATMLMSKTTSPIAPIIKVSLVGTKKTVSMSGTAIFKKDKMVGEMNKTETRGMLWVLGKVKKGAIVVNYPDSNNKVTLEITRASSKIIPEIEDGRVRMKIVINEEGNLGDQSDSSDLTKPKFFEALQDEKAAKIKSEIMSSLKKAQSLHADVFSFGEAISQNYPDKWKLIENNWDEIFGDINVDIVVECKLRRSGRITKPITSKD